MGPPTLALGPPWAPYANAVVHPEELSFWCVFVCFSPARHLGGPIWNDVGPILRSDFFASDFSVRFLRPNFPSEFCVRFFAFAVASPPPLPPFSRLRPPFPKRVPAASPNKRNYWILASNPTSRLGAQFVESKKRSENQFKNRFLEWVQKCNLEWVQKCKKE